MEAFLRRIGVVYTPSRHGQTGNRLLDHLYPLGALMIFIPPLKK